MNKQIAEKLGWAEEADGWHAVGDFFEEGTIRRTAYPVTLPDFTHSMDACFKYIVPWWYEHGLYGIFFDYEEKEISVTTREWSTRKPFELGKESEAVCKAFLEV